MLLKQLGSIGLTCRSLSYYSLGCVYITSWLPGFARASPSLLLPPHSLLLSTLPPSLRLPGFAQNIIAKSLVAPPKLQTTVRSNLGDRKQYFIPKVHRHKCLRDESHDCGDSDPLVTFVLHQIVNVSSAVLNPQRRDRFLVLTCVLRVERLISRW